MPVDVTPAIRPLVARLLQEDGVEAAYGDLLLALVDGTMAEGGGQHALTLLPALTCQAHGGDPARAAPACAAWLLVRLAAKLLDDVEDGDVGREQPLHVNAASGLVALAHLCVHALAREGVPHARATRLDAALSRAILCAAGGQHRDLVATREAASLDPDGWLAIAAAKSGAPLAWAAGAGAAVAGARGARLEGYRRFGACLGVLLQIADDYNDVWAPEAPGRLRLDAPNLALAYAQFVADGADRRRLDEALDAARRGDAGATQEVGAVLTDLGAQAFVLAAGHVQRHGAVEALAATGAPPAMARRLNALLEDVMPALRLVAEA